MAERAKALQDQQLIWENLEQNIVDVSDAISGALTNGLADIVTGARSIQDVGRELLDGIASTFLDSAQQQLSVMLQRQFAGMLGGPDGPLSSQCARHVRRRPGLRVFRRPGRPCFLCRRP